MQGPAEEPTATGQVKPLRLRKGFTQQAPAGDEALEVTLVRLKKRLLATYRHHTKPARNHTQEEIQTLKNLKKDESIIFKQSDKCKGIVVMDRNNYIEKAKVITDAYEPVARNPTPRNEALTKRIIKTTLTGKTEEKIVQGITPQSSRTAELYGLPKDHKPGIPLRPIVSACGDPLDGLSSLLENITSQLLQFVPAHLRNTDEYLKRLNDAFPDHQLPPGAIVFSVDVVNLYGNIPVTEGISAVISLLEQHHHEVDCHGLSTSDVKGLLHHVLTANYVRFGEKYFRQTSGIAMGNRVAPPTAIIFMDALERKMIEQAPRKPTAYMRYIDDTLAVWTHGKEELDLFLQHLNQAHDTVKFTMESTADQGKLAFLDTLISVDEDGKYQTELYIKPTSSNIILHYESAQPMSMKKAVLRSQFQRAARLSSNDAARHRSTKKIIELFITNGYPKKLVQHQLHIMNTKSRARTSRKPQRRLRLPYIDEDLTNKVNNIIRSSDLDIQTAWTNRKNLKSLLIRSALDPAPCPAGGRSCNACNAGIKGSCHTTGAVYEMKCQLCPLSYVGETGRMVRLRYNEHLADARHQRLEKPWGGHFAEKHPDITPSPNNIKITILQRVQDIVERKIAETIHLRRLRPALNTQLSSWAVL